MFMLDLLIIGAGPAGVTASIYASRYKLSNLVIGNPLDASLAKAHLVENWPGEKSIKGADLLEKFTDHAKSLGGEFDSNNVGNVTKKDDFFEVVTTQGKTYQSKAVVICSGTFERKLGVPGEKELLGKGVSYCAICDGPFFKEKNVAVVGGGNSAVMASLMLSEHAKKVYLVHRSDNFKSEPVVLERVKKNPKIEVVAGYNLSEISGDSKVEKVTLDKEYDGKNEIALDGVFVEIGLIPNSVLLNNLGVDLDEDGSVIVDQGGQTNIEGVFSAGDITNGSGKVRQILSACSEGMIAATSAYRFIKK